MNGQNRNVDYERGFGREAGFGWGRGRRGGPGQAWTGRGNGRGLGRRPWCMGGQGWWRGQADSQTGLAEEARNLRIRLQAIEDRLSNE